MYKNKTFVLNREKLGQHSIILTKENTDFPKLEKADNLLKNGATLDEYEYNNIQKYTPAITKSKY